ncbi:MAG: glycine--tRNA ligase subunit beta, partial [Pseudomonadales bacterium]
DMVGEFPELQGIMGAHYARHDGEEDAVATAIAEHYRPTQSGGALPSSLPGCCVALADKLDTLVGLFGIGQPPSGSRDPFALRRQALGVIRICIEMRLELDMPSCLKEAAAQYSFDQDATVAAVSAYMTERLTNWYGDQNIGADKVAAVGGGKMGLSDYWRADEAVRQLADFSNLEVAEQAIAANKRVANILRKEGANDNAMVQVDPDLFETDTEAQLHDALNAVSAKFASGDLGLPEKIAELAAMQPRIDQFFDKVLVMADDPRVQANRVGLLVNLRWLFLDVADFSLLQ